MENASSYRLWQAPSREQKLVPFRKDNDLGNVRAIFDVTVVHEQILATFFMRIT